MQKEIYNKNTLHAFIILLLGIGHIILAPLTYLIVFLLLSYVISSLTTYPLLDTNYIVFLSLGMTIIRFIFNIPSILKESENITEVVYEKFNK